MDVTLFRARFGVWYSWAGRVARVGHSKLKEATLIRWLFGGWSSPCSASSCRDTLVGQGVHSMLRIRWNSYGCGVKSQLAMHIKRESAWAAVYTIYKAVGLPLKPIWSAQGCEVNNNLKASTRARKR